MSECPRESVSGTFEETFAHDQKGAAAAEKWLRETRKWIHETFDDWCKNDEGCSQTLVLIKDTSGTDPKTKDQRFTISFRVICYSGKEGEYNPKLHA